MASESRPYGDAKVSRYRSARVPAQLSSQAAPPSKAQAVDASKPELASRSMSRYRRPRAVTAGARDGVQATNPSPQMPPSSFSSPSRTRADSARVIDPAGTRGGSAVQAERRIAEPNISPPARQPSDVDKDVFDARAAARQQLTGESAQKMRKQEQVIAGHRANTGRERKRSDTERGTAGGEERNAERLPRAQGEPVSHRPAHAIPHTYKDDVRAPPRPQPGQQERYGHTKELSQSSPTQTPAAVISSQPGSESETRKPRFSFLKKKNGNAAPESAQILANTPLYERSAGDGPPATIKPGGGGVVPGIDAPVSAVNAGDRRVLVECNKSSIILPVTPSTTPMDLIRSAANCLSEPIDPKASVLLESFGKVGVQRPLRKYEHIRDVMNSWDEDRQNSLVLVESATGGVDEDLTAANVPADRPSENSFTLYYSQKPGKWDKRWILLRSDGQMVLAKHEGAKETTNVCHLSDFDIYSPSPKQVARKVKPPKKICFAIKSQQKTSMFMTRSTYVHFFCTNDRDVGTEFYRAVQGWRSWYLVNVMGEGMKNSATQSAAPTFSDQQREAEKPNLAGKHARMASMESHYQLGSFKPLLDLSQFDKQPEEFQSRPPTARQSHKHNMSVQSNKASLTDDSSRKQHSAGALRNGGDRRPSLTQGNGAQVPEETAFAPSGLLGRTYSQRQRAQRERELANQNNGPFTDGPSLLRDLDSKPVAAVPRSSLDKDHPSIPQRRTSVRSTTRNSADKNALSGPGSVRREMCKPLVDLTPQYREPPQHQRKGKGFVPDQVGPRGLIDAATSPDVPFSIPPSTDWRARPRANTGANPPSYRPSTSGGAAPGAAAGSFDPTGRTRSLRGGGLHPVKPTMAGGDPPVPPLDSSTEPFTGQGLLARAGPSQGGHSTGKGVMTGARAKGPMLDVSERSRFVPGSLLAGVEKRVGSSGPVLDREKDGA